MIHAYDDPLHAPLGLRAAQRYAKVAPAAFHALHMPSHIFLQLGMWNETIASNEHSYAVSKQWADSKHLGRAKRDLHSLQWLQYAYLQADRIADARKLLDEIAPAEHEDAKERTARANMLARFAIETNDWSVLPESASMTTNDAQHAGCATSKYSDDSAALVFARGIAGVKTAKPAIAADALARLQERAKEKKNVAVAVMAKELEAMMSKDAEGALKLAAEAAALEDTMGAPSGPPDTFLPAHELYGEVLIENKRLEDAGRQFEIALSRTPNRRRSLRGAQQTMVITPFVLDPSAAGQ
jgi:hypothetical protein